MDYAILWLFTIRLIISFEHVNSWYYQRNYINSYLDPRGKPIYSKINKQRSISLIQYYWDLFNPRYKYRQRTYFKFPIMEKMDSHYLNTQLSGHKKEIGPYPQNSGSRGQKVPTLQTDYLYLPSSSCLFNPFFIKMQHSKGGRCSFIRNGWQIHPNMGSRYVYNNGIKKKRISSVPENYIKENIVHKANKEIFPKTKFAERLIMPSKIVISNLNSWDSLKKNEIQSHNLSLSMIYNIPLTKNKNHIRKSTDCSFPGEGTKKVTYVISIPKKNRLGFNQKNLVRTTSVLTSENYINLNKPTAKIERYKQREQDEYKCYQTKEDILVQKKTHTTVKFSDGTNCSFDKAASFKQRRESTPTPIMFRFDEYFCECKRSARPQNKNKHITNKIKNNTTKNESKLIKSKVPPKNNLIAQEQNYRLIDNSRFKRRTFKYKGRSNKKQAFTSMQCPDYDQNRKQLSSFRRIASHSSLKNNYPHSKKICKLQKNQLHINAKKMQYKSYKNISQTYLRSKNCFKKADDKTRQWKREFVGEYRDDNNYTNYCEDFAEIMTTLMIYSETFETKSIRVNTSQEPQDISTEEMTDESTSILEGTSESTTIPEWGDESTTVPEGPNESTIPEGPNESKTIPDETDELTTIIEGPNEPTTVPDRVNESMILETGEVSTTIEHNKLVPERGTPHPAKLLCEEQYKVECACHVPSVLTELNTMITNYDNQKLLLEQLKSYNCSNYRPMKVNYKISPESKPRLISNKHKELLVDDNNGPKEIIDETFQELMLRGIPNEGLDFYVFPSTNVEIPCFINSDVQLSPNSQDSTTYVWRQGNNKVITGGRVTEDLNHRGMLRIVEATLSDSDNYTCTVNYKNPDREQVISNSFIHSVMVVTLPKFALHTLLHYNAKVKCDQETLEMFDLYLPQKIEELICYIETDQRKICTVEIHNPMCLPKNLEVKNGEPKSAWKLRNVWPRQDVHGSQENEDNKIEMSLNFELDLLDISETMPSAANRTRFGPFCQLKVVLKLLEILQESFTLALANEVRLSVGPTFEPDITTINMKILIACEGGFQLIQGFCLPCPVNTFSEEGNTCCSKCPSGMFQPNIGSKSCEKCPDPFKTGCSALWTSPHVIALLVLFVILTIFISVLVFWGCKIIMGRCMYSCIYKFFKKKNLTKPEDVLLRKLIKKKSLKTRANKVDTSDPPTPPEEDFTS